MLEPGTVLQGRYRIEDQIGQGGMGTVYLARQIRLADRAVAIKELKPTGSRPDERAAFVKQFEREARILATLQHPGLVDVKDFFEENHWLYLVMDYIDGKTLAQIVRQPADPAHLLDMIDWGLQVTEVLHYLHNHSPVIVVRDLKPGNVMLQKDGRIRLIDFGIAREFRDSQSDSSTTAFMKGAGSPGFAPPEQYGSNTDPRTDIYALGATLYACIAAKVPPISVLLMAGEEVLRPLNEVNPVVCPKLSRVIHQMMSLKRDDRPQTVAVVEVLLREARAAQLAFETGEEVDSGPLAAVPTQLLDRVCPQCSGFLAGSDTCPKCSSMMPTAQETEASRPRQASYWQNVLPPSAALPTPPTAS
ncbi:MAG TPA: protein kinase, partial [Candidatus Xenobia bacterium]